MSEVKNAVLFTNDSGFAQLNLVDENYEIHSLTGPVETLRIILQGVELPNYTWRHSSDGRTYHAEGPRYKGRYGGRGMALIDQYRKKSDAA